MLKLITKSFIKSVSKRGLQHDRAQTWISGFDFNRIGSAGDMVKITPLNDWQILRRRYGSTRSYKNRIALQKSKLEEFSNWLVDIGADVYSKTEQNEILRFRHNGVLGIWYESGSGNLLMHDLAAEFLESLKVA